MFDTTGRTVHGAARKDNTLRKLDRVNKALRHEEPDRVPISDFFWGGFIQRWRRELGLPPDANPYYHYDLDWIVTVPNMDPWIRPFETLKETPEEVEVKTGFGAIVHKHLSYPMPEMRAWETDTFEKLESARFDHPRDPRRFFCAGDNQVWEAGERDAIRREVLRKLNAAKGGGMIFQSDHSVSSSVSGHTYDHIVQLVREHGRYPLQLGEFDLQS